MKIDRVTEKLIGIGLAVLAFAVYWHTLSHGAYPRQASLIVTHCGLRPRLMPDAPIWSALVSVIHSGFPGSYVFVLNFISAICGALAVWMLFGLMVEGISLYAEGSVFTPWQQRMASIVAGVTSALCLAFCIPFWMVSNRAHMMSFDIVMLLLAARLLLLYMDYGRFWIALLFSFVFGVGVVEFPTFIVISPVFGAWLLYIMWKREVLNARSVTALVGCALLGLLAYIPAAFQFYKSPGYELTNLNGFFDVIWQMWRMQYAIITHGLPRDGWLIILFVSVVPWLAMLSVIRRGLNDERDWGVYSLHIIMTAIMVAVVLNFKISPLAIAGPWRLLVTPYVLIAMVCGYLAAYWLLLPTGRARESESQLARTVWSALGWVLAVALTGLLVVTAFLNAPLASTDQAEFTNKFCDEVIDSMAGRRWLVTAGYFDDNLLLAADRKGVEFTPLNILNSNNSIYLDYLATLFDEPRLKNMAQISVSTLLGELVKKDAANIATLTMPEIWERYGYVAVPERLVFFGVKKNATVDLDKLVRDNSKFQQRFKKILAENKDIKGSDVYYRLGRRYAGLVANDLGVFLEERNRDEDAFKAYAAAREIDPDNVSALLNMGAMVADGRAEDPGNVISNAVKELTSDTKAKHHAWALAHYYGYVHSPEAFARLGQGWVYSGQPGMAISQFERAEKMMAGKNRDRVRQMMADIFMSDNQTAKSEGLYRELLADDPHNISALLGMMNICVARGDYARAGGFLTVAEKSGLNEADAAVMRAGLAFASGKNKEAKQILDDILLSHRKLLRGWVLLANIGFSTDDEKLVARSLRRIEDIEGDRGYFGSLIRGYQAAEKMDLRTAADAFTIALKKNPYNSPLREKLLRFEMMLGEQDKASRDIKMLLLENPDNALALYFKGSLQLANGKKELAEDSLRHSIKIKRDPLALNDLAWLLQEKGQYKEAAALIDEALKAKNTVPAFWDTKGVILLGQKKYNEAVEAFARALAISGKDPGVALHMAQAQLALGNKAAVKDILKNVARLKDSLPPELLEIYGKLEFALTPSSSKQKK